MISLEQVEKRYRQGSSEIHALRSTTLDVRGGDFVAVVGPSGSGKSTLLSILGGMLGPTSGRIVFDGTSVYDVGVAERARLRNERIGFVFQNFNLIPWMTAFENVELPLRLYGSDRKYARVRARELLEQFGLADRTEHRPAELSAGQQQRVALARTLVTNPTLVLADEPTGNLDPDSRDLVLRTLKEFRNDRRVIILVTHDTAVSRAAGRVLTIADGVVSESPSLHDVGAESDVA